MAWRRRRGGKPDANQEALVKLARRLGATVRITSLVGFGFPDVAIGFRGINLLAEGKLPDTNPLRPTKRKTQKPRKLTKTEENQARFRAEWAGQVTVIEGWADVLALLTAADTVRRVREGMIFDEAYQRAKVDMAALAAQLVADAAGAVPGTEPGPVVRPLPFEDGGASDRTS